MNCLAPSSHTSHTACMTHLTDVISFYILIHLRNLTIWRTINTICCTVVYICMTSKKVNSNIVKGSNKFGLSFSFVKLAGFNTQFVHLELCVCLYCAFNIMSKWLKSQEAALSLRGLFSISMLPCWSRGMSELPVIISNLCFLLFLISNMSYIHTQRNTLTQEA